MEARWGIEPHKQALQTYRHASDSLAKKCGALCQTELPEHKAPGRI